MAVVKRVAVLGAGGHSKVVIASIEAAGWEVAGLFDDHQDLWGSEILGHPVGGPLEAALACECDGSVIAVGDNNARREIAGRLHIPWAVVVHPSAWIADSASLGEGSVVFAHSVIQPDARLGRHVVVNTGASVDHDCDVGDFAHIAPGAGLGGNVKVGAGCLIGIGAVVAPGVSVGPWSVVGAGAAVVSEVGPSTTVVGVPARVLAP